MVLSALIQRLNDSVAAKVGAVVLVVAIVGGVGFEVVSSSACGALNNGYGPQVSPQAMADSAKKELDQVKASNLPPGLKAAEIKHLQGELDQSQGNSKPTPVGPPPETNH